MIKIGFSEEIDMSSMFPVREGAYSPGGMLENDKLYVCREHYTGIVVAISKGTKEAEQLESLFSKCFETEPISRICLLPIIFKNTDDGEAFSDLVVNTAARKYNEGKRDGISSIRGPIKAALGLL